MKNFFTKWLKVLRQNKKASILGAIVIFVSVLIAILTGIFQHIEIFDLITNIFCVLIVAAAAIEDFKRKIIPNKIILTGLIFGVICILIKIFALHQALPNAVLFSLIGCAFGGGVFIICAVIAKNSVGMGDIKIFGMLGFIYGFEKIFNILFFSLLICAIFGIGLLISKKKKRKDTLALAPFALAGMLITIILGG